MIDLQAHHREFNGYLSAGVIPSLIDAGFVSVVRWALDNNAVDSSLSAAVDALHALIVCADDEVCLSLWWFASAQL